METIGDFEYSKKDLIGHGAFAVVFKGRQKKKPDHTVAIKCITKKNLAKSQNLLSKEIKILKELSDLQHDNVVALLDCKETSHHVYLVMEYCNGGDLADYLQAKGTLSEDTISSFLRQIAGAMKALNAKGIVHRDLKPQNILLCHPGKKESSLADINLKIADFGFARFLQDGVMAATLCGSPMYMAPEVIMSIQYDAKADLWSVGTIVYQCLTGKAPFQAQTPQQLKMFYERNANLSPNIPPGTSPELRDLLMKLLKRNARDRIEFDDFFRHHFLYPPTKSSPVPVPRRRSRSSISESPPMKTVSASPLSGFAAASPPNLLPPKPRPLPPLPPPVQEPMEVVCSQGSASAGSPSSQGPRESQMSQGPRSVVSAACGTEGASVPSEKSLHTDDFVMVPENLPSDHSVFSSAASVKPAVNLNAIFSNKTPESPRSSKKAVEVVSPVGSAPHSKLCDSPQQTSPSRPSSLPGVQSPAQPTGRSSTQPIPVPSQVKAYEKIQRSTGMSPSSPLVDKSPNLDHVDSPKPEFGMPIPRKPSTGSLPSVGSMSPPAVQFTIGTPPSTTWKRNSPTPNSSSPHRRPPLQRISTTPSIFQAPPASPLPTILGSPTKVPSTLQFLSPTEERESPGSPLVAPFGRLRTRANTCPSELNVVDHSPEGLAGTVTKLVPVSEQEPMLYHKTPSASKLSDQLLKAAFGATGSNQGLAMTKQVAQSPPGNIVVPYSTSSNSLPRAGSNTSLREAPPEVNRQRTYSGCEETGFVGRQRKYSNCCDESPKGSLPFAQSPTNMEGPVMFIAPELAEETLMDKVHNDTVSKLNFILALVECIIELAQSRSSPLSESIMEPVPDTAEELFSLDHIAFLSESQRRMEQLVLYVRALQLLTSSIELAMGEVKEGRLQSSNNVKNVLREMNNYYHQCLGVCRNLHNQGVALNPDTNPQAAAITADKLIYSYAIEMCQTAALDELFGNPQECFRRYRNAHILLHSLGQQTDNETDRQLLSKYRLAVEKRLYSLQSQPQVFPHETS